jgi:hypothetical protein
MSSLDGKADEEKADDDRVDRMMGRCVLSSTSSCRHGVNHLHSRICALHDCRDGDMNEKYKRTA